MRFSLSSDEPCSLNLEPATLYDATLCQRNGAVARQDPDGAFARLAAMQRRLEGQFAAARDWSADPENVAWADHPFVGPMLEPTLARELLRLADAALNALSIHRDR